MSSFSRRNLRTLTGIFGAAHFRRWAKMEPVASLARHTIHETAKAECASTGAITITATSDELRPSDTKAVELVKETIEAALKSISDEVYLKNINIEVE
jgi:hypothetical protein